MGIIKAKGLEKKKKACYNRAIGRKAVAFMGLFKSKGEKELEHILFEMKCNLENNYKDSAHNARKRLMERADALYAEGKIKEKVYQKYRLIYEEYTERLKDYRH